MQIGRFLGFRVRLGALATMALLALVAAPAGFGGTLAIDGSTGVLTYTAGPEGSNVSVEADPFECHPDFGSNPCITIYDTAGITSIPSQFCRYHFDTTNGWADCVSYDYYFVVNLGAGNDQFRGWDSVASLGIYGDSTVNAGPGNDEIDGAGGDDVINGEGDADVISGGAGNDTMNGGDGNDELETRAANPPSSTGTDVLSGGPGDDKVEYSLRDDGLRITLDGAANDTDNDNVGSDIETIIGGNGADTIVGNAGPNRLYGVGGNDQISGGDGNDYVDGGSGDDRIGGEGGDDEARGGSGSDALDGGIGVDQFFGDEACTIWSCYGGSDTVSARDGFVDSVSCGIAADTAIVDHNDVVATDFQQGCETIDRGAAPPPPPTPQPPAPPAPKPQPKKASAKKASAKKKVKKLAVCHRGRTVRVTKKQLKKHLRHGDRRGACKPKKRR
jgi:Ca2+-binding RTX toxin-like protein